MGYEAVMNKRWSSLVPRTFDFSKRGLGTRLEVEVVTPINTVPTTLSCNLMSWARPSHRRGSWPETRVNFPKSYEFDFSSVV